MDISKFNKELSYKVAKANGLEKNNKILEAIDEWVEITEMVLRVSKSPKLEFSYKSMLIEKTKQIIEHIKTLKLKLRGYIKEEYHIEEDYIEEEAIQEENLSHEKVEEKGNLSDLESSKLNGQIDNEDKVKENSESKSFKGSELKDLPKGFKEIEAPKDFEIITPHDKEYIHQILSKDVDMSLFKHGEDLLSKDKKGETSIKPINRLDDRICFACGIELPPNVKRCPNCGTLMKS